MRCERKHSMFKNVLKLLLTGRVEVRKVEEGGFNIFNRKWKIKHLMFKDYNKKMENKAPYVLGL